MSPLNEAARRQTLIESLQAVAAQLNSAAREAAAQMILAAEYIEHLPPPKESD